MVVFDGSLKRFKCRVCSIYIFFSIDTRKKTRYRTEKKMFEHFTHINITSKLFCFKKNNNKFIFETCLSFRRNFLPSGLSFSFFSHTGIFTRHLTSQWRLDRFPDIYLLEKKTGGRHYSSIYSFFIYFQTWIVLLLR